MEHICHLGSPAAVGYLARPGSRLRHTLLTDSRGGRPDDWWHGAQGQKARSFRLVAETHGSSESTDILKSPVEEFYDLGFNLFRTDFYSKGLYGLAKGPFTLIHDFNLKTQYLINRQYRNCSVTEITLDNQLFDAVDEDGQPTLASPAQLFQLTNEFNYSYEGVTTVRGVEVDSWLSYREFIEYPGEYNVSDVLYELFFTRPEWTVGSYSFADSSQPSLWRVKVSGLYSFSNSTTNLTETQNFSATYDTFAFNRGEPNLDVFDTSACVPPSQYYIVSLHLPVDVGVQVDFSQLPRNVRAELALSTGVRPLQIGNIQVIGGNETALILSLHISNLSNISLPRDPTPVSAYQAVLKLTDTASKNKDNKLNFQIQLAPGSYATPLLMWIRSENGTIYQGFHHNDNKTDPVCKSKSDSDRSSLSDGAIAGIAVWMLVLGLGIGVIGTLVVLALVPCLRKRSSLPAAKVSYKKQVDEAVTVST
jgi:hypothetical protein